MANKCEWNPSEHNGKPCPTHKGGSESIERKGLVKETLVDKFNDAHLYNDGGKFQLALGNGKVEEFDTYNEAIDRLSEYSGRDYSWAKKTSDFDSDYEEEFDLETEKAKDEEQKYQREMSKAQDETVRLNTQEEDEKPDWWERDDNPVDITNQKPGVAVKYSNGFDDDYDEEELDKKYEEGIKEIEKSDFKALGTFAHGTLLDYAYGRISKEELIEKFKEHYPKKGK